MAKRIREKTAKINENREKRPHACAKYVRIAPSKAMVIADIVRGKSYDEAVGILNALPNSSAGLILKVVESAGANADNNRGLNRADLRIAEITIDQGPTLKRAYAAGKGSSMSILKRTSHINVVLDSAK